MNPAIAHRIRKIIAKEIFEIALDRNCKFVAESDFAELSVELYLNTKNQRSIPFVVRFYLFKEEEDGIFDYISPYVEDCEVGWYEWEKRIDDLRTRGIFYNLDRKIQDYIDNAIEEECERRDE